ncbi:MAG: BTAD domain-containing putative transcriptional regulator [Actinomycetota bacterium]
MSGYKLQLLGGFSLTHGNEVLAAPNDVQRVLAFLALHGPALARSVVAGGLWIESSEDHANGSLRSALWRLRRIANELVQTEKTCVSLGSNVRVDIDELTEAADTYSNPSLAMDADESVDIALFKRELLPGWYDDWAILERERLKQLSVHTLESMARHLAGLGRFAKAIDAAIGAIGMDPLRETPRRTLIAIHLAEGNRSEAYRHYDVYTTLLRRELGIEPSPALALTLHEDGASEHAAFTRTSLRS